MPRISGDFAYALVLLALGPAAVAAQGSAQGAAQGAPTPPCHDTLCTLNLDWGAGKSSSSYPVDRKYGSGDDFEVKLKSALAAHGYRLTDHATGSLTMTLRPTMKGRVMCDQMAGTNTDYSCTAMSELAVSFTSGDPAVKAPGAIRVANRCGASDIYMTMAVVAQYSADMIYYRLEGEAKKERRPVSNC